MPPADTLQLVTTGGAVMVLLLMVWWSRDGTLRWGKTVDAQAAQYEKQLADLAQQLKDVRAAWVAELAQVRADKDAQIARELTRVDSAWKYLEETLAAQQQIAHSAARLVNGSVDSGPLPPPPGPAPPAPSTRPRRSS